MKKDYVTPDMQVEIFETDYEITTSGWDGPELDLESLGLEEYGAY